MVLLIIQGILYAVARILFAIESFLGRILDVLYESFLIFADVESVTYNNRSAYIMDIFFNNSIITTVFWGMALIGIILSFAFGIASIIKKLFDTSGEKVKATYGMILGNLFKSILLIFFLTAIVNATILATSTLMTSVNDLFDNAEQIANPDEIYFDDEDYATMFRILDTIGNYSLNPASESRFNLNTCFNAIRPDLYILAQSGVFNYTYDEYPNSWQYAIRMIYVAGGAQSDIPVDLYNDKVTDAIEYTVRQLKNDGSFKPLNYYKRSETYNEQNISLGRTLLLCATIDAAYDSKYNEKGSLTDNLRRPFFTGEKNIYNYDTASDYFDISLFTWNHILALIALCMAIIEFCKIIINCIARIFNIVLLYITAPWFAAVMPLDDGGKMKQWTIAYVIQSLSIFGTLIAVRLMIAFIPIIVDGNLVIFPDSSFGNIVAKMVFILAVCFTAQKASNMISGILADNAGYQAIMAGDVGSGMVQKGLAIGAGASRLALKAGGAVLGGVSTALGLGTLKDAAGKKLKDMGTSMRENGGIFGAMSKGWTTKEGEDAKAKKQQQEDDAKFKKDLTSGIGAIRQGIGELGKPKTTTTSTQTGKPDNSGNNDKGGGQNTNNLNNSAEQAPSNQAEQADNSRIGTSFSDDNLTSSKFSNMGQKEFGFDDNESNPSKSSYGSQTDDNLNTSSRTKGFSLDNPEGIKNPERDMSRFNLKDNSNVGTSRTTDNLTSSNLSRQGMAEFGGTQMGFGSNEAPDQRPKNLNINNPQSISSKVAKPIPSKAKRTSSEAPQMRGGMKLDD